jgi:hypothetical protein
LLQMRITRSAAIAQSGRYRRSMAARYARDGRRESAAFAARRLSIGKKVRIWLS